MSQKIIIPSADNSGSTGQQGSEDEGENLVVADQLVGHQVANAINGIAATKSRALGGEAAAALVAANSMQMAQEIETQRVELASLRNRCDTLASSLSDEKSRVAVLEDRAVGESYVKHLRNLSILIGTTLLLVSVELFDKKYIGYAGMSGLFGILLTVFGWIGAGRKRS